MGSITAANAVIFLSLPPIFPVPQQIQGFSADDVFGITAIEPAEVQMGIDGVQSAGFVFVSKKWAITLQADSLSNDFFDAWIQAQELILDTYRATAVVILTSIGKKWAMTNGVLTSYPPMPEAKKVLQPRKYEMTWEKISVATA